MKNKLVLIIVTFIFLIVVFVSPASAGGSAIGLCEVYGGTWVPDDPYATSNDYANMGKCYFKRGVDSYYTKCGKDFAITETWNYGLQSSKCVLSTAPWPVDYFETTPGAQQTAWKGHCGVHIFSAPATGSILLTNPTKAGVPNPAPNYGKVCEAFFVDSEGNNLSHWNSVTKVFFNLDKITKGFYDDGTLNFYIYEDGNWNICYDMQYLPYEGSTGYGRVACYSSEPTMFGLGTGLGKYKIPKPKVTVVAP